MEQDAVGGSFEGLRRIEEKGKNWNDCQRKIEKGSYRAVLVKKVPPIPIFNMKSP